MLVLSANMYKSVYGESVHIVYVVYECWCCRRFSLMVSVGMLLIIVYVLHWRRRRGCHAVLKYLGICTDGIHISLCIVWVVSVLVLLDVISWVRVPVFVYVLVGCLRLGCQFAWYICIVGVHISLCIVLIVIMLVSLSQQGILGVSICISLCIV